MQRIIGNKLSSTRPLCRWVTVLVAMAAPMQARAAVTDQRCITVSDVVIVGGTEAWANKKLCKSPGSARYDVVEVAAAVYGAATTQAAFDKAANPKLRAQRAEIETLRAQMRAGRGEQLALLRAQQKFVADLAAKDRAYSEAIQQFRSTVVDIAATPEGIAALAQYNAGDEIGALAILDRLRTANDAARQTQSNIASAAEGRRIADLAYDALGKGKVTNAAVIARYEDVTRLDPGVSRDWTDLARLYQVAGKLPRAADAIKLALGLAQKDRDKSAALTEFGDIQMQQGHIAGAAKAYGDALAISRKLAAARPDDWKVQIDLSLDISNNGDSAEALGDLAGAEKAFRESLSIARKLAAADPANDFALRIVASDVRAIGALRRAQNDPAGAGEAFRECIEVNRRLLSADPVNVYRKGAIAACLEAYAIILAEKNDLVAASRFFGEDLSLVREVAAFDPGNSSARLNVSDTLNQIGYLRFMQRDLDAADAAYGESLAITRTMIQADPTNANRQRRLSEVLENLGELRIAQNDLVAAESAYRECFAISRQLTAANPNDARAQRYVAIALAGLAHILNSGVHWHDVAAQWQQMEGKGLLAPADKRNLDDARKKAALDAAAK